MAEEIRIYFEGDANLKPGFDVFFSELRKQAPAKRCRVLSVATGGNPERDFAIALRQHPAAWNILLRDSEGPLQPHQSEHASSIFWMVQMMEAWFHADKGAIARYYGQNFPKLDLIKGLKAATNDTKKGTYHKTRHAPKLLQKIDPAKVRAAAPNCERLFQAVLAALTPASPSPAAPSS